MKELGEVIEATAQELEPAPESGNLFRSDDPAEVLARATAAANALAPVLTARGLTTKIQGREHVRVEGWLTLGAMLGVTPVCVWTRKLDDGWEARVEARTLDGRVVGAAEGECLRAESTWKNRDDYALRSMAQTRATSKALASVLRFVVTLAGFEGTPAEEMPSGPAGGPPSGVKPSDKQLEFLVQLAKKAGADDAAALQIQVYAAEKLTGGQTGSVSKAIDKLKGDDAGGFLLKMLEAAEGWQAKQTDMPADTEGLPGA